MNEMDIPVVKLDDDEIRKFDAYFDELRQEEAKWIATVLGNLAVATVVTGVISAASSWNQSYVNSLDANKSIQVETVIFPVSLGICCVLMAISLYFRGKQVLRRGYKND